MNLVLSILVFLSTPFYREPIKQALPKIDNNIVWVYFTDKGFRTESEYEKITQDFNPNLSNDAIQRRVGYSGIVYDYDDLPVYQKYVDEIVSLGAQLRTESNWLNAASFNISPGLLERIYNLPFVYNLTPVIVHQQEITDALTINRNTDKSGNKPDTAELRRIYGLSYEQNKMLGIPQVFNKGYTGSRVKLGLLDTGLKRIHNALKNLKIFKEHDFLGGDNFFIIRNEHIESIPNIINTSMTSTPLLYKTQSDRLFLIYSADTLLNPSSPVYRGLYYSYSNNQGQTWSNPQSIFLSVTYNMSIPSASITGKDSVVYVSWQDLLPQAPNQPKPNIYLGYFIQTTWHQGPAIDSGKYPNICIKGNELLSTYTIDDSILYFRKADISFSTPLLLPRVMVGAFIEPIINPVVLADSFGEIEIFAVGLHSQIIYHYKSTDNGISFQSLTNIDGIASSLKAQVIGNTIYLLYKDYSNTPQVKLALRKSTDGGNTWSDKKSVTNELLTIGDFSFAVKDTIFATYELQDNIYLVKSVDFGNTWSEPITIAQDFVYSPNITILNNQPLIVWLQRGDNNTDYEEGKDFLEQPDHGTRMASIIGAYQKFQMIGTAPGVDFLIAKTELFKARSGYTYETTTEEDIWVQGLEWAEREGASVISSSLGYRSWYTDKDFDGRTIPMSIAAGLAAKRGVIVVNAMGNRDTTVFPWPTRYIVAPADAYGIIAAGGVTKSFSPWLRTGIGPTYDGRIKPELSALADTAIVVAPDSSDSYEGSIGTSCATALLAGCCAVLFEAHPEWNADSVKNALFTTASLNVQNCTLGWGVPNIDSALKVYPPTRQEYYSDQLGDPYPNPYPIQSQLKIYFPLLLMNKPSVAKIRIYTINGDLVKIIELNTQFLPAPGRYGTNGAINELENINAMWNGENESGKKVGSGLYFAVLKTSFGQDLRKFAVVR
jgi:hypothetical protein